MKVYIASSREIGIICTDWAKSHLPQGWEIADYSKNADVFISVMYNELLEEKFIRQRRCYNFHPGILPSYRGSGAFSWALINGDKECGITLHKINKDIDHGEIIEIRKFSVEQNDTAESLYNKGMVVMENMFIDYFHHLLINEYIAQKPQGVDRLYYRKDLEEQKNLTRFVKAFTFEGKEQCYFINKFGHKIYLDYEAIGD